MKAKAPQETEEQRAVRLRAETDNVRAIQETVQERTDMFRRRKSGRVSITTGQVARPGMY